MELSLSPRLSSLRRWKPLPFLLVGLFSLGVLLLSMYRMPSFGRGIEEIKKTSVFFNIFPVEQTNLFPTDDGGYYAWTQPGDSSDKTAPPTTVLRLPQLQRVNAFYLTLEMSLDRPGEAPPARVQLSLLDENDRYLSTLAVLVYDPAHPGFNRYQVVIPPDEKRQGLGIEIKSNAFHLNGQAGEYGVRLRSYTIEQKDNPYLRYIWPEPYIPAALILGSGILA